MSTELKRASALAQAGRFSEAAAIYREVLERSPGHAEAAHFLGICLVQSGNREEGLPLLERSLRLAPRNAMYRVNYGLMLAEAGGVAAAAAQFEAALQLEPRNATAHNYLGMARQRLGKFEEAIAAYHQALRLAPGDAAAANNLGYCLHERGDIEGASAWLERSLAADPRNPMAHNNLGNAQRAAGRIDAAVQSYRRALELAPSLADAHHNLALALRDLGDAGGALDAAREAVHCAPANAAAWQLFADLLASARFGAWDAGFAADCERLFSQTEVEVQDCAEAVLSLVRGGPRGRLFLLLLEHALVADADFETEMAALRREQLHAPTSLELVCALAQQCFLNEYVWPETPEETRILESLKTSTAMEVALRAMYRPLRGIEKPAGGGEAFERLWRRLVDEPRAEAALEPAIPALAPVEDEVSLQVQRQYEANPYPRWHRAPAAAPNPLPRMLRSLFPHAKVECSGVLHHMADPLAGWRTLLGLLKPGGVMKLGLYSELARRDIAAARALVSGLEVREARERILALPAGHPARKVAALRDFYSGSGARDLILHVQEQCFTVARLAQAIDALGVELLGFEFADKSVPRAYRERFPDDPAACSFDNWTRFEQEHPDTFASMYQFWIRR